jgi:hypothetical protein
MQGGGEPGHLLRIVGVFSPVLEIGGADPQRKRKATEHMKARPPLAALDS